MSFIHLACGGAGTVPVDSGLPRVGELYGVEADGDLRWYRYDGTGQRSPNGSVGWAQNSRNVIGNGWNGFKFLCGGGDGLLFGVEPNGDLRWYQYTAGDGVEDRAGSRGWDSNSQNIIGNGWANFVHLVCTPKAGRASSHPASTLYGVEANGDLRWYRYVGSGIADRSGNTGWAPNSRNVIGNGWQNFKILFAASSALFGVERNGDLRWYSYEGDGTPDRSGGTGWHPNSRNIIGNGWDRFSRIVGGPDDHGGFGVALYGVEPNGDLYWYKYLGNGESDPSGAAGWHPNSGNQIGKGW
ncbi:MAG TPA: tachylectin-related carbohydrate-binding protein [Roseiarcus sp.]|nr:tachylectin-related carbohydrate-binding protein [Roseiarcus sp.]